MKRQPWAWKCQLCGEITETSTKKREPAICENPNCDNRKQFKSITTETTGFETDQILAEEIVDEDDEVKFAYMDPSGSHYAPYIDAEDQRFIPRVDEVEQTRRRTIVWNDQKFDALYKRYVPGFVTDVTDVTGYTGTTTLEENRSSIYTDGDRGADTHTPVTTVIPVTPVRLRPTVFQIKRRLWKAFGVRPFKPSELTEHFSDDDLERVNRVISKMKENGEIRLVPTESGITAWQLTPKEQG